MYLPSSWSMKSPPMNCQVLSPQAARALERERGNSRDLMLVSSGQGGLSTVEEHLSVNFADISTVLMMTTAKVI